MEIGDSPMHGLDFCVGSWSEMTSGESGVQEALRYFGSRDKIFYVHFRDVVGNVPKFREAFVSEGNCNMLEVMQTLKEVEFNGFLITDHVPHVVNDTPWGHRGRAHAIGYMTALLEIINAQA